MSRFDTIMQTVWMSAFRRNLGDPAAYETPAGESKNTWAIIGQTTDQAGEFGERSEFRAVAQMPRADVPLPLSGATLAVKGKIYRIGALIDADDYFVTVSIRETP